MDINGHELEMKYVLKINLLKEHIDSPKLLDFIWVKKYRKELRQRLNILEQSLSEGFIDQEAFSIWNKMIKEVL
jgi:hypothetical protein